jgi:hypothetical protein
MMKHAILAAALMAAPAVAADYLPTGPQLGVALATVTGGGWSLCYSATMATPFGNDASALAGCTGDRLMLAGRETGSDTLLVLAQAAAADVLFDTGTSDNTTTHLANGTEWYYAPTWSWGFAPAGESVFKTQCDINGGDGRICIHTFDFVGGYRINGIQGLNSSTDYEKLVFSFDGGGVIPEPATWAMMIAGFGLVGAAARRRRLANA